MKTRIFILAFICALASIPLLAQHKRVVSKTYEVSGPASLTIKNSFGDVKILAGKTGFIETSILITITSNRNESDMQKYFDEIRIDARRSGNDVSFTTLNTLSKMRNVNNFSIDYVVRVPIGTALVINNTFGDIAVEVKAGILDLNVEHGDIAISDADGGIHRIDIKFGDVRAQSLTQSEVKIQHGDFNGGRVQSMTMNSQFGDVELASCGGNSTFNVQHGDLTINDIDSDLSAFDAAIQFGDIEISGFDKRECNIDVSSNFGDINWEGEFKVQKLSSGINNSRFRLISPVGSGKIPVSMNSQHGDIIIK